MAIVLTGVTLRTRRQRLPRCPFARPLHVHGSPAGCAPSSSTRHSQSDCCTSTGRKRTPWRCASLLRVAGWRKPIGWLLRSAV